MGACSSLSSRDTIIGGREEISYAALGGFTWAYSNPAAYEHSLLHGVQNKHGTDVDDECDLLSSMNHRPPLEGSARQEDTTMSVNTTSETPASEAFTCEFRRMVLPAGFLRGATPHWTSEGTAVHPPNTATQARSRPLVAHKGSFHQSDQSEADHATHPPSVEKGRLFCICSKTRDIPHHLHSSVLSRFSCISSILHNNTQHGRPAGTLQPHGRDGVCKREQSPSAFLINYS